MEENLNNEYEKQINQKKAVNNNKKYSKPKYTLENLQVIKSKQQVLTMYVEKVDESFNLVGVIGNNIKAIMPRNEISTIVGEDGFVESKHIVNKAGKKIQACIKEININPDNTTTVILSKRILEMKVRKWMYMHLKAGMKLKGIVRSITDYYAVIDVGGGVTGIIKKDDIADIKIYDIHDVFRLGQRITVIVKKYDRDTGKIELSYKEIFGSFDTNIKKIAEGDIIEGIVKNRTKAGIFVLLKHNLIGLAEHVNGVEYDQKVLVNVKKIVPEKKKIKLIIIG